METKLNLFVRAALVVAVVGVVAPMLSAANVTVVVDSANPGAVVPDDYTGLSYEIQLLLPQKDGSYYFSASNTSLINTLKLLGVKNIRIGGNTSDNPAVAIPSEKDIDNFFAFAKAADVKVIYTLRLRGVTDPADAVRTARYVMSKHKSQVQCLAIGNEPNVYLKTYPEYKAALETFITAITAPDVAPDAVFCGPCSTPGKGLWARDLANDMGKGGKLKIITQHSYPGSSAKRVTDPADARAKMLSQEWVSGYAKMHDAIAPSVLQNGLTLRLEECNSFFHGGAKDVSDTFASTLWALDFMHWWASHDCAGLNFHTGDTVASGDNQTVCRYAIYTTREGGGYDVRPIGYALKAFDIAGRGRVVPVKVTSDEKINLNAYAIRSGSDLYVTLISKAYGSTGSNARVAIEAGREFGSADLMHLSVPGSDITATSGVTLGGGSIGADAAWNGTWTKLDQPKAGKLEVEVPAASAVIVKLLR
jgi:hypothetical protein